jgi:hypothetical protein
VADYDEDEGPVEIEGYDDSDEFFKTKDYL